MCIIIICAYTIFCINTKKKIKFNVDTKSSMIRWWQLEETTINANVYKYLVFGYSELLGDTVHVCCPQPLNISTTTERPFRLKLAIQFCNYNYDMPKASQHFYSVCASFAHVWHLFVPYQSSYHKITYILSHLAHCTSVQ